jgi:hypothetical protein
MIDIDHVRFWPFSDVTRLESGMRTKTGIRRQSGIYALTLVVSPSSYDTRSKTSASRSGSPA